jgi:2'-5' RNA ligase
VGAGDTGCLAHWLAVSSTRRRLGVALLLDPPVADAVDGLRRALGDPSLGRVGPHLTLVPPVNIRGDQLGAALARIRSAAARTGPLQLTLGPPATFLPDNPVLYLEVGGDLDRLRALRDAAFAPPLERTLSWPWVPHVTVADSAEEARIAAAVVALDRFATVTSVEYLVLLQEMGGRIWRPIADAALGPPAIVGRGGLALEITRGRMFDPEVLQMIEAAGCDDVSPVTTGSSFFPITLAGRREGEPVGAALAWRADDGGHVAVVVAPGVRAQGIGGTLLAHLEAAVSDARWNCPVLHADGPPGFYRARSGWAISRTAPRRRGPVS